MMKFIADLRREMGHHPMLWAVPAFFTVLGFVIEPILGAVLAVTTLAFLFYSPDPDA